MNNLLKFSLLVLLSVHCLPASARLLHIIHTNDLHSYFKGYRDGRGGYARLKTRIEELRAESRAKGIEVLQLDAGDFGEGTSFFLSKEGSASIRALGMLGTDVAVIGNHDHMMGGPVLGNQIRKASVSTKLISANLVQKPQMQLTDVVKSHVDLVKAGKKLRIIGLSTAEVHFQYQLKPGFIMPAVPVGVSQAREAKKQGREIVIALTHIGQGKDVELARESTDIDLIVGGHSHDFLETVRWEKNKNKKSVPIVQAGSHGLVVGSLLVDLRDDGKLEVKSYKLHRILDGLPEDPVMDSFVAEAAEDRNQYFDGRWEEIIGESRVPLSGYVNGRPVKKETCWGRHMAKLTQDAAGSTVAIHLADFEGELVPPGPITFGDMIDNFPHFRNYGDPGWEISTINVKGTVLKALLGAIITLKGKFGVNFSGFTYKSIKILGKEFPYSLKENGRSIESKKIYTVAFPSEVAFALKESLPSVTQKLFPGLTGTGKFYWKVIEEYLRKNSPISCN